ncbi:MAG: hypothetical protein QOE90_426 [Thermoplasmata archaeon]|jgi:hypothetical protein|nr:hypothetical protein [Thermoplasmata archaeon]
MGATRLALYLVGLVIVVVAAWVFLTQTPVGRQVPSSLALVLILLLVGIGVMAAASNINESRVTRRVVREGAPGYVAPPAYERRVYDTRYAPGYVEPPVDGETIVDERRFD